MFIEHVLITGQCAQGVLIYVMLLDPYKNPVM